MMEIQSVLAYSHCPSHFLRITWIRTADVMFAYLLPFRSRDRAAQQWYIH